MKDNNQNKNPFQKYVIVFFITFFIFFSAIYFSNVLSSKKIKQLNEIQNQISLDILASETQFSILSEASCKNVNDSFLAGELDELGRKIEWSEDNINKEEELNYLRKYYTLLQVKDFLLMKKIQERCGGDYAFLLFFYTDKEYCPECERQSIILSSLKNDYPNLRIYSFDYSIGLSVTNSLLQIFNIEDTKLPALVLGEEVYTGLNSFDDLETQMLKSFPYLEKPIDSEGSELPEKNQEE